MAASVLWLWACASTNEPFSLTSCACSSACATGTPRALTAQTASVTMYERVIWDLLGLRPQDATGWREEGPTAAEIHRMRAMTKTTSRMPGVGDLAMPRSPDIRRRVRERYGRRERSR